MEGNPRGGSGGDGDGDAPERGVPADKSAKDYIKLLEERNRLLRRLEEKKRTKAQRSREERERGFSVYMSGANRDAKADKERTGRDSARREAQREGRPAWRRERRRRRAAPSQSESGAADSGPLPAWARAVAESGAGSGVGAMRSGERGTADRAGPRIRRRQWAVDSSVRIRAEDGDVVRLRAEETSDATRDPVVELPGQQFGDGGEDGFDDADTVLAGSPPSTPEATGLEPAPSTVRARGSSSEGADDDEAAYSESFDSEEEAPSPTHDAGAGAGTGASPAPVGPVPHGAGGARPTAATTAELLARVQRLPTGQQRVLLGVLSQLEAGEERPEVVESAETEALVRASVGNPESWGQIVACLGQGGPTEEEEEGEGDTAVAPPSSEPAPAPAAREEVAVGGAHWLLVRLLGPHNGGTVVGLTGLEVVARSTGGRHQPVTGLDVRLCWLSDAEAAALEGRASASLSCLPTPAPTSPTDSLTPQRAAQRLQCLVDGVTRTREEGHMWKCPLEGAGCVGRPALLLRLPPDCGRPVELRVWNYNRSLHLLSLGVGDCEVWVDGARAWQGRLRRGCGNAKFEYAESVPLVDGGGEVEEEGEREGEEVAETGAEEAVGVGEGRGASDEGDEGTARGLDVGSGVGGEESTTRAVQSEQSGRRAEGTAVAPGASPQEQVDTAGDAPVITGASTTGEAAPRPSSPGEGGDAVHPRGGDAPVPLAASPSQAAAAAASTPSPARRSRDAPSSGGGGSATQELRRSLAEESLLAASQVGSPALLSPPRAATRKLAGRRAQLLAVRREQMMSEQQEVREVREAREKERERRLAVADSLLQQALEGYSEAAGRSTSPPPNDGSGDGGVAGGGGDGGIQAVPRAGRRSRRGRPDPPPADDDASTTAPAEAPPPRAAASGLEPGQARFGRRASVEDRLPSRRPRGGGGAEEGEGEGAEGPVQREAGRADEPALPTEAPLSAVERPASPDASALELSGTLVEIPELPAGETMQVSVASTWGDPRYVGLAGIDVFDDSGAPVRLGPGAVRATPRGVCDLPGHSGDPRTADKLCDGVNFTCDARHMWLAPFYPERGARITLRLPRRVRVAMIRVWNYNKSRVASERGARAVTITLDGSPVFSGEVRRAPGTLAEGPDACSEVILCTLDAAVLARIEAHDEECLVADRDGTTEAVAALLSEQEAARPSTAARPGRGARATLRGARAVTRKGQQPDVLVRRRRHQRGEGEEAVEATAAADERPPTALHVSAGAPAASSRGDWVRAEEEEEMERSSAQDPVLAPPPRASRSTGLRVSPQPASASSATALVEGKEGKEEDKQWALDDDDIARILAEAEMSDSDVDSPHGGGGDSGVHASLQGEEQPTGVSPNAAGGAAGDDLAWLLQRGPLLEGREVELEVLSTWGDPFYAGLTGVELLVVGEGGEVVPEPNARVDATPRDLNVGGHSGDPRVLGNLLNGDNCTVDERSMWLVAQPQGGHAAPRVSCPRPRHLAGLRVWNYNKSVEDAERGVRSARCRVDGVDCGVLLFRRAPGDDWADYAQVLSLAQTPVPAPHPSAFSAVREVTASSQSAGEYDAPAGVSGFEFTLVLLSTWGDAYYVGLCGLQLLAPSGQALPVSPGQVKASPASVNDLPDAVAGPSGDPRVPANLVTGSVEADRVDESWLAPHAASLVPGQPNVVRIVFDEPAAVAALLVHNYAKTPARGVREFQLWVDGCIAYHGLLPPRTHAPQGHLIAVGTPSFPVRLLPPGGKQASRRAEQDVVFINDGRAVARSGAPQPATGMASRYSGPIDLEKRPGTAVPPGARV